VTIGKKKRFLPAGILAAALMATAVLAGQRGEVPARPTAVAPPLDDGSTIYLYVSVTDRANTPVPGLLPTDFEIYEDDVKQEIAEFTVDTAPISLGVIWGPNIPIGNTILAFLKASAPNTEYFVVANDTVIAPFTTDLRKVPRTVAQSDLELFPSGGRDAIHIGLDVLSEAAAYVRRVLLVVGRTVRANPVARPAFGNGATYDSLTKTAVRTGMQIYTIGVEGQPPSAFIGLSEGPSINPSGRTATPNIGGGFEVPGMTTRSGNGNNNTPTTGIQGFGGIGNIGINGLDFLGQNFNQNSDAIELQNMAAITGGQSYFVQNTDTGIGNDTGELEAVAEQIARGLQLQYRIGYRPTNKSKDGKWRNIGLKVQTADNVNVWTRSGYFAAKEAGKKP
jgi:VWFA-related protein